VKLDTKEQKATVELTVGELLSELVQGKLKIEQSPNPLLAPGARGPLPKQIGGSQEKLTLKLGQDILAVQFTSNPLAPIALVSKVKPVKVDKLIPQLGLRIKGVIELELNIEISPNYMTLATTPGIRQWIARGAIRVAARIHVDIWTGRAAIANAWRFGGKLVGYVPTLLRAAGRGLVRGARPVGRALAFAARALPGVLRVINVGSLIVEGAVFPFRVLLDARDARKQGLERALLGAYRTGYAQELTYLTAANWRTWFAAWTAGPSTRRKAWKTPPPRNDDDLSDWLEQHGTDAEVRGYELLMVDPIERWSESLRIYLAVTSRTSGGFEIRQVAEEQADLAGRAAALQDIFGYVIASTRDVFGADDAVLTESGLDAWDGVASMHRRWYGDGNVRQGKYERDGEIYPGYVGILPFWGD
jgi:hypothetical protein